MEKNDILEKVCKNVGNTYERLLKEISESRRKSHYAAGHPAYQCKEGYIVAIYPEGREVKLQKANHSIKLIKNV